MTPGPIELAIKLVQKSVDSLHDELVDGLREIRTRLDTKADKADVRALSARVDESTGALSGRVKTLEDAERSRVASEATADQFHHRRYTRREKVLGGIGAFIAAAWVGGVPLLVCMLFPHR
jgi:hypothetical protein